MIRLIQWGNYRLAIIAEGNAIVSLDDDVYSLYPEFLNRIDGIVIFDRIKQDDMQQIVDVQLPALARHIEASKNIRLEFADSTKKALATEGYDPAFGARPLKRVIQNRKLNALAKNIIDGSIKQGSEVIVKYDNNKYSFDTKQRVTLW